MTVTDAVHDIAFAPNLGRSFHVLAIATKDVRIFKLVPMRSFIYLNVFSHMHTRGSPDGLLCGIVCFCNRINVIGTAAPCSANWSRVDTGSRMKSGRAESSRVHVWKGRRQSFQFLGCVLITVIHRTGRTARLRDPPSLRCRLWLSLTTTTLRCGAWAGTSPARCWPLPGTTAACASGKVRSLACADCSLVCWTVS